MDYSGVARGATVQGGVGVAAVTGFDAGMAWLVVALCMMVLGLVMYAIVLQRNRRDDIAAGIIGRTKRNQHFRS